MSLKSLREKSASALDGAQPKALVDSASTPKRPVTAPGATAMMQPTIDALNERTKAAELRAAELEAKVKDLESQALPVTVIEPNPWQPRRIFDQGEIERLALSIEEVGLIQPIVVRRKSVSNVDTPPPGGAAGNSVSNVDIYQLVAGERRLRAHHILGREAIKAVVVEVSDEDMALQALAENIDRLDLTDFEISKAIRSAQAQFKTVKRLAEAVGIGRTDLYRYLDFANLPAFVLEDLEQTPGVLGRAAASEIVRAIKQHGQPAVDALLKLWPRIKSGDLDQGKAVPTIAAVLERGSEAKTERDIRKLFVGKDQAGSITRDARKLQVTIKTAALTPEKEAELRAFVEKLFT